VSAFHDVRFPEDISYGSSGGPEFSTSVVASVSGHEQRNIHWANARARYNVAYGVRTDAQLSVLIAFFRARFGRAHAFRFRDWADWQTAPVISANDSWLGDGNGSRTTFQLLRRYASGYQEHVRTISKPVPGTVRVALQGTEINSGWSVNALTGLLTFDAAPAPGVLITAGFAFDVPVRFDTDHLATSLDSYGIGSALDVPVVEVRE
jgi:uncharacterized protein (TIGR02217 family)